MPRVLIADDLSPRAAEIFRARGIEADVEIGLKPAELARRIASYDGLAVRSATKVTAELIGAADALKVIGRAGIGVDNIDVAAATERGIVVMNTPYGNSITAAEHKDVLLVRVQGGDGVSAGLQSGLTRQRSPKRIAMELAAARSHRSPKRVAMEEAAAQASTRRHRRPDHTWAIRRAKHGENFRPDNLSSRSRGTCSPTRARRRGSPAGSTETTSRPTRAEPSRRSTSSSTPSIARPSG